MTSSAIDRGKAGDVEGIRYLYVRYSDDVYGYVRSIVRDDHEAEDITQHVFAKLMTVLVKYDDRGIPFLAWLLRLARNVAIDHLRGSRAVPAAEIFGADERAEELVAERSRSLREALGTLPDEQRSVVVLRHVVGMSPGEIASRLGRSESSIHGLHHRGRRALQEELVRRESAPCTLAVAGFEVPFVRLDRDDPELLEELVGVVRSVAEAGAFVLGRHVEGFESDLAAYCGTEHAVGVASGTQALELALRALGVGPGDEAIVPANTFIATAEAVSAVGATPRLVDVDPVTGLLTADAVAAALGPHTRCVIPVHLFGATVDMDPIVALAREAGVAVVEDACQAHGARYRGRRVGSIGDAGCFSFYPAKNLGAWGDGGAVVTNRADVADQVSLYRSHGERPRYNHRFAGTTARLDALQAAILRVKLRRLDGWNDARRAAAAALRRALTGTRVELPAAPVAGGDHVYHLFVVQHDDRNALRDALTARGIASAVHYPTPIHLTAAYAHLDHKPGSLPIAERHAARICSLPVYPTMTADDITAVAAAVTQAAG